MPQRVAILIFPRFQLLDAAGPIAAFEIANRYHPDTYQGRIVAASPGDTPSSSGATLASVSFGDAAAVDTLIVVGGEGTREAVNCFMTHLFVRDCAEHSRRVASVCSGSYVLAAAGLLDGRVATTHWSRSADFARRYPQVRLDADRIFTRDGKFWTSAGVTAGIDLALALIEEDGRAGVPEPASLLAGISARDRAHTGESRGAPACRCSSRGAREWPALRAGSRPPRRLRAS